jgi:adenine-specific DNA-methyltransferase
VQFPEPLNIEDKDQKTAAAFCDKLKRPRNIAEITKERLRRALERIKQRKGDAAGDVGFRVLKLDSTNIREWVPDNVNLEGAIQASIEHLKSDRNERDVLVELLLKLGLDLCVSTETKAIKGKNVYAIGSGVLIVCLAQNIKADEVESLALGILEWHKSLAPAGEVTCVFRDSAFEDDVAKSNMAAILEQHGLKNVRSL